MSKSLVFWLAVLALLCAPLCFSSPSVLDPAARIAASGYGGVRMSRVSSDSGNETRYVSVILELAPDGDVNDLDRLGAVVFNSRGSLVLACIPEERLSELGSLTWIKRVSLSRHCMANLDKARAATLVDGILDGSVPDLPCLDGSGVVVGFTDIGFDPSHEVFAGRVALFSHHNDETATVTRCYSLSDQLDFGTDNADEYHATHVGGILAGADPEGVYRGVASGATIVAATSILHDVGILAGIEDVIDYAREVGLPAVVNMSIGSCIGPHDGSDLFTRYLDLCAEDAAIVLSAGNNGSGRVSLRHTFSASEPSVISVVKEPDSGACLRMSGAVDGWSSDARECAVRVRIYDVNVLDYIYDSPYVSLSDGVDYWGTDSENDADFAKCFKGAVAMAAEVSPDNDRYHFLIQYSLENMDYSHLGPWARYYLCVETRGAEGVHVDIYPDGQSSVLEHLGGVSGQKDADSSMSISSLACGFNTIAVGSATTRDSATLLSGETVSWAGFVDEGTVSSFSSYGTLADGRVLPHICAPGAYVISACSSPFIAANPWAEGQLASRSADGCYAYIPECGTSMASPHVAGIFALWLQADPSLSPAELRDVAVRTASTRGVDLSNPRSGAGVIDAQAGLRYIIERNSVRGVDLPAPVVRRGADGRLVVESPGCDAPVVVVCDLLGRQVDADAKLPVAPVVVKVTTPSATIVKKL